MSNTLSKEHLRELRNRIEIIPLIADVLEMTYKTHDGRFRFMCPLCHQFDTAVNPNTNLARCFRCKRNFNPIDMVMTVKRYSFMQAVRFLEPILQHLLAHAEHKTQIQAPRPRSLQQWCNDAKHSTHPSR